MAVIYLVSYSSMYEELYNEVKMFSSKEDAIKHCNSIVEDINNELDEEDKRTNVFDDYQYGYKKYVAVKPYTNVEWLVTLNEINTPFETDEKVIAPSDEEEECIDIYLTPEKYPIAFKNKVDELVELGVYETRKDAEIELRKYPIQLDLIYEKHYGLFAVESEALDLCTSPYSKKDIEIDKNYEDEDY